MFGFQRIGDFVCAGGDMQSRGFLIGGTAGRTTLAGEGLQHQDGHSLINASTIPNCIAYDPTYAYELAVIIHNGLQRMMGKQENIFYYITCMNENYSHPKMPENTEAGILKGMYLLKDGKNKESDSRPQLMGSGTILREVLAAADMLDKDFSISCDVWSVTSFNELRREALEIDRSNQLNPSARKKYSYLHKCLKNKKGPFIAATDYMKLVPDQIQKWIPGKYTTLGTDGYGRSDARKALRDHFEVDSRYIVLATLSSLLDEGKIEQKVVLDAIKKYKINIDKTDPVKL
jgi:pyruvate dehydrogenase E1 component